MVVSIFMASVTTRGWPFFYAFSALYKDSYDRTERVAATSPGLLGSAFLLTMVFWSTFFVDHVDFPFRTVEHESNGPHAPIIGIAYVDEFDDGLHAFIQSDRDFFVFVMPKKKVGVSRR